MKVKNHCSSLQLTSSCMVVAGLLNGVLLRTEVDKVTGQLSDTRTRFLGTRPPKLFAVSVRGKRSMLALSSRPWLVRSLPAAATRISLPPHACPAAATIYCLDEKVDDWFLT